MDNLQRELLINWWSAKFLEVLDRREEDVFNFVFIMGKGAKSALLEALTTDNIDVALDNANKVFEVMKLKYGDIFIEAKRAYITNMFDSYAKIEGGRK